MWNGENPVKIAYRQRAVVHAVEPLFLLGILALGAMAVAARVVGDAFMAAFFIRTGIYMATHSGRAALTEYT